MGRTNRCCKKQWVASRISNNGSLQGCTRHDKFGCDVLVHQIFFCCTHPSLSARYRKVLNCYKRIAALQNSLCFDLPHVRCSFNFRVCKFQLLGTRKICMSLGNPEVEMYRPETHRDKVRDPNMPGTND